MILRTFYEVVCVFSKRFRKFFKFPKSVLKFQDKKWLYDNFSGGNNFKLKFELRFRKFEKFPKSFSKRRQNCQRAIIYASEL